MNGIRAESFCIIDKKVCYRIDEIVQHNENDCEQWQWKSIPNKFKSIKVCANKNVSVTTKYFVTDAFSWILVKRCTRSCGCSFPISSLF